MQEGNVIIIFIVQILTLKQYNFLNVKSSTVANIIDIHFTIDVYL